MKHFHQMMMNPGRLYSSKPKDNSWMSQESLLQFGLSKMSVVGTVEFLLPYPRKMRDTESDRDRSSLVASKVKTYYEPNRHIANSVI
mmetsp:Transcript_1232/g.1578  ORF Transcript_1232/g.1578 Transcript_1232/m.1578 type:complete len:87 (+) Transcript_1232:1446-1706(+)